MLRDTCAPNRPPCDGCAGARDRRPHAPPAEPSRRCRPQRWLPDRSAVRVGKGMMESAGSKHLARTTSVAIIPPLTSRWTSTDARRAHAVRRTAVRSAGATTSSRRAPPLRGTQSTRRVRRVSGMSEDVGPSITERARYQRRPRLHARGTSFSVVSRMWGRASALLTAALKGCPTCARSTLRRSAGRGRCAARGHRRRSPVTRIPG
jgi:hypothetical protein